LAFAEFLLFEFAEFRLFVFAELRLFELIEETPAVFLLPLLFWTTPTLLGTVRSFSLRGRLAFVSMIPVEVFAVPEVFIAEEFVVVVVVVLALLSPPAHPLNKPLSSNIPITPVDFFI